MVTDDNAYIIDWRDERYPNESFGGHLIIGCLAKMRDDHPLVVDIIEKGDDGKHKLTVQINGVEVNAKAWLDGLESQLDSMVADEAQKLLNDVVDPISELLDDVTKTLKGSIKRLGFP